MAELGVNEHHRAQVINYLRFARYQRNMRIRAVEMCFEDLKNSRLDETTYTIDEVTELLDGLLSVVKGEVDDELINTAHTNILLMRQMFIQAEKWHLKLAADISELENSELLEEIAEFEDQQFANTKTDRDFEGVLKNVKLVPIDEMGGTALLHRKIEELEVKIHHLDMNNTKMKDQIINLGGAAALAKLSLTDVGDGEKKNSGNTDDMKQKMASLQAELDSSRKKDASSSSRMETDLSSTKHELLRIREMLEMAEKELEKKVHQTTPFKNLKQMLVKKNDQMKTLRKRLAKYEQVDED